MAERFDFVIAGAGTAGCLLAARLSEDPAVAVALVEAGPDYGPYDDGGWPAEMLDARGIPVTHDWEHEGDASLLRARIVGGCSAHNACFVVWGARGDYDEWADAAPGWSFAELEPYLRRGEAGLGTRLPEARELSAFHHGALEAAARLGIPRLEDFNDLDTGAGIAPVPLNARGPVRWNSAFAYLDSARARPNLEVIAETLVDRVAIDKGAATGLVVRARGEQRELAAGTVVLASGAYGSPAILLRSGIGPEPALRELGIEPVAGLEGVGANLIEHPGVTLYFEPGDELRDSLAAQHEAGLLFQGQCAIRAASELCAEGLWDLQLLPWASPKASEPVEGPFETHISIFAMKPASRGQVALRSTDPDERPGVEQRFLSDPDGRDLSVLLDGVARARELVATEPLASALAGEAGPATGITERAELEEWAGANARGFFHPVGTCAMGPASEPAAVVDERGAVHGIVGLHVADASIMPTIPRANTNLPTTAVADRIAALLASRGSAAI